MTRSAVAQPTQSTLAHDLVVVNNDSSKVVDENGEPLVVYHGSRWNPLSESDGQGVSRNDNISGTSEGVVFYFTPDKGVAEGYGDATAVFRNLKHPVYAYSKPKLLTEDELDSYESDEADNAEALVEGKTIARAKDKMREVIGVLKKGYSFKDGVETVSYDSQATTVESLLDYVSGIDEHSEGDYDSEQFQKDLRNAQMEVFGIDGYYLPNYAGNGAYVAFTPEQIKPATPRSGVFGSDNLDIRFSVNERERIRLIIRSGCSVGPR